ncbi:MAG TPA: cell division protein FtsZ [Bacteroidales bacterium]|nr:cell division protein FtsZ [Bacteroidales bacterium]
MKFDTSTNKNASIIKVIGVGGGGSNAVNHMFKQGIKDVDFILCNTDAQALAISDVPVKIQLGSRITEGRGAGSIPSVGKECALENVDEIRTLLQDNTKMLFITAGMGGGTGTGAAPVIASIAKELGILTVAIVTMPFNFEGAKRKKQAEEGIKELRKYVDTLLIICNEKLRELYGDLKLSEAFRKADNVLTTAAKGIAEIITVPGYVNVDFEDVKTVMKNSGVAIMGTGSAEGENRAIQSVEMALSSPLLNDNQIKGAKNILLYIASGNDEISMDEVSDITDYIQQEAGSTAEIIWGNGYDEKLGSKISVTIIATGFESSVLDEVEQKKLILNGQEINKNQAKLNKEDNITDIKIKYKTPDEVKNHAILNPSQTKQKNYYQLEMDVDNLSMNKPITENINELENINVLSQQKAKPEKINSPEIDFEKKLQENQIAIERKNQDRYELLRAYSMKLKTPEGLAEFENQPAFMRREILFNDKTQCSSDTPISDYTISLDENNKGKIMGDNSFLNKKVD